MDNILANANEGSRDQDECDLHIFTAYYRTCSAGYDCRMICNLPHYSQPDQLTRRRV